MNKTTFILLITLIISYINTAYIQAQTQRVTVQGSILEKDTQFPVEQATIQLLSLPDSNYIKGISSLEQGKFSLTTLPGRFLLKISFIGFATEYKPLQINTTQTIVQLGKIELNNSLGCVY